MKSKKKAPASAIVYDRSPHSIETLIELCAPSPPMRANVAAWLADPTVDYLLIFATGLGSQMGTIGARNREHLLNDVLPDLLNFFDKGAVAESYCTALDPDLSELVDERWQSIVAKKH